MTDIVLWSALLAVQLVSMGMDRKWVRRTKELELRSNAQVKATVRLHHRVEAQARYLRISVKDRIAWSDEHDRRIKKLERVGHSHAEMNLEKPKYHIHIDGRDIRPKPE